MKDTGGSAFPLGVAPEREHCSGLDELQRISSINDARKGMTLRDYLAASALPAIIRYATETAIQGSLHGEIKSDDVAKMLDPNCWAETSYKMADAMIEARKK